MSDYRPVGQFLVYGPRHNEISKSSFVLIFLLIVGLAYVAFAVLATLAAAKGYYAPAYLLAPIKLIRAIWG
jgi:hypothetical protein